jgi:hypothetical protein
MTPDQSPGILLGTCDYCLRDVWDGLDVFEGEDTLAHGHCARDEGAES